MLRSTRLGDSQSKTEGVGSRPPHRGGDRRSHNPEFAGKAISV